MNQRRFTTSVPRRTGNKKLVWVGLTNALRLPETLHTLAAGGAGELVHSRGVKVNPFQPGSAENRWLRQAFQESNMVAVKLTRTFEDGPRVRVLAEFRRNRQAFGALFLNFREVNGRVEGIAQFHLHNSDALKRAGVRIED